MGAKNPMYGKPLSPDHRRKIGRRGEKHWAYGMNWHYGHPGEKHFNAGRRHTAEQNKLQSDRQKGKHFSPETEFMRGMIPWNKGTKGICGAWNKVKKQSEEHRRKNSAAKTGSNHPNWGKPLPQKTIDNIRTTRQLRVPEEERNWLCTACGLWSHWIQSMRRHICDMHKGRATIIKYSEG